MSSEDIQGDEWDAYVTLETYSRDERGIACRARALRRHSARSSRRSDCDVRSHVVSECVDWRFGLMSKT